LPADPVSKITYEENFVAKASDLKRGMIVEINGIPHVVKQIEVRSPSSRGASTLYKIRFNNMKTGQKLDETLKGDDFFKDADCVRAKVQYSYQDGDNYIFMNLDDYSQYSLNSEDLEGKIEYLTEGLEGIVALLIDDAILGIELPSSVILSIVETAPAIKGATATGRTKTARLQTGVEVQVPEYLETGELVKINTETGKFMSRA
jgi:elongation factor P